MRQRSLKNRRLKTNAPLYYSVSQLLKIIAERKEETTELLTYYSSIAINRLNLRQH
jgi:hypothetical protein